jgi:hypothetical protein
LTLLSGGDMVIAHCSLSGTRGLAALDGQRLHSTFGGKTVKLYHRPRLALRFPILPGLLLFGSVANADNIFVVNQGARTIGEYTTSGATVNAALISGLNSPTAIAVSGSDLFVVNAGSGTIGEYTTSGATVATALISG